MGNCCSNEVVTATVARDSAGGVGKAAATTPAAPATPTQPTGSTQHIATPINNADTTDDANYHSLGTPNGLHTPISSSSTSSPLPKIHTPKKRTVRGESLDLDVPGETHTVQIGNYNLRYSYYSKRGYYPEGKINSFRSCSAVTHISVNRSAQEGEPRLVLLRNVLRRRRSKSIFLSV